MRKLKLKIGVILMTGVILSTIAGCGKKVEVAITDGEDITEAQSEYPTLEKSTADKFSYNDLVVGNIKYLMTEDEVRSKLGTPANTYDSQESKDNTNNNQYAEHVLSYNDLTLIFMQFDGVYKLTAAASVSENDTFSRGIKVGDKFEDILKLYYRDSNCMNNNYYTDDKSVVLGKFLYGDFTIDNLETVKTTGPVNYGVINYNGFASIESADSYIVEFTSFDSKYKNSVASISDDFAQLAFDIDNSGVITGIRWYYYPEENN